MDQAPVDWTQFRKRIHITASAEQVYAAWAVPEKLETWFLESARYERPQGTDLPGNRRVEQGDHFTWKWNNWDITQAGEVLTANGTDTIAFTFGVGGVVTVTLREQTDQTELTLVQTEVPTDDTSKHQIYVGCATAWSFWLANLKAWLEHGITLHAKGLKQEETADLVNN